MKIHFSLFKSPQNKKSNGPNNEKVDGQKFPHDNMKCRERLYPFDH